MIIFQVHIPHAMFSLMFEMQSCIRGNHIYKNIICMPFVGETLICQKEEDTMIYLDVVANNSHTASGKLILADINLTVCMKNVKLSN